MVNIGVAPPDPSTEIGSLRYAIGDTEYNPLVPPVEGFGDYEIFSDAELQSLLDMGGGIPANAIGFAYLKLAGQAASTAIDWKSDDLSLSMSKTPAELRAIAAMWFSQGEAALANADIFDIFPTVGDGGFIPELSIPIYGRRYTWGRWR